MKQRTSDPNRRFVRCVVPAPVHRHAKLIARYMNVTVTYFYTVMLTRELYNVNPAEYAAQLVADLQYPESEEDPNE